MKGGTTSLWGYLDQHPEIYMAPVKEPHFFTRAEPLATRALIHSYTDEQSYLDLFSDARDEKLRGEASASYFADPETPALIKQVSPDAKILVILRDPVERAYSHYWHVVAYGAERRTFSDTVRNELAGDQHPGVEPYAAGGFYVEPLQRYFRTFGDSVRK